MLPEKNQVLERSLVRLEFKQLLAFLAELARSDPGRTAALALTPSRSIDQAQKELALLQEMLNLENAGMSFPLGYFSQISPLVENARIGSSLAPSELLEILRFLEQARKCAGFLLTIREKFPGLASFRERIPDFSSLQSRLDRTVDEHGEVRDSASPALAGLRAEFAGLRSRIQKSLEQMLSSQRLEEIIQDSFYTEREGRLVIPVKSSAQNRLPGIVHDSSASGATVFIEPLEMVPHNNRLRVLQREIQAEIARLIAELGREIAEAGEGLLLALSALTELDLIQAKAGLARKIEASVPVLDQGGPLALYQVRHPLLVLEGKKAVANDLVLDPATRVLVISGPNTGGKTVFMKTLGLLALMTSAGMAIPAHPDSRMNFFTGVFAEIGDDQSLTQDLSSYSAHLLSLVAFLEYAEPGALVLVDEILGSTDPEEGSALAIAILGELLRRGALTAVTTHNSRLKAFAENEPGFMNASFEFDPKNLSPTYHLRLGIPGPSYGIATAQKLGLEQRLLEAAQNLLTPEARQITELVSRLDRKQTELDQRLRSLEARERELAQARESLEERSSLLLDREKNLKREMRQKLEAELHSMRVRFNALFEQAKQEPGKEIKAEFGRELSAMKDDLEQHYPEPEMGETIPARDWQAGDLAWVSKLRARARVLAIDPAQEQALLAIGSIRLQEKLTGLRRIRSAEKTAEREEAQSGAGPERMVSPVQTSMNTLDLRGERAEEAEIELVSFLDRMSRQAVPAVFIIHGHGTGVLKKMVRENLQSSVYVQSFRPGEQGEGGDGVTVVFLEKMSR